MSEVTSKELSLIAAAVRCNGEVSHHVGVTGTRRPLTEPQKMTVTSLIASFASHWKILHHGDCVGADEYVASMARRVGYKLHSHPPFSSEWRAFVESDFHEKNKSYLERNRDVVVSSSALIALPCQYREVQRSGTWATIRIAQKLDKLIAAIWPDGRVTFSGGNLTDPIRL